MEKECGHRWGYNAERRVVTCVYCGVDYQELVTPGPWNPSRVR